MADSLLHRHHRAAAFWAAGCALALALAPAPALAKTWSPDDQLPQDVYSSLGLETSGLDEAAAKETAPYDASEAGSTSTLLTKNETYIAASGQKKDRYVLRNKLNTLDDRVWDRGIEMWATVRDEYGSMYGGYNFWKLNDGFIGGHTMASDNPLYYSNLSTNTSDVMWNVNGRWERDMQPPDNGFDGLYATSEACDLGSGWDDCMVELRADGAGSTTTIDGKSYRGSIYLKVMQLGGTSGSTPGAGSTTRTEIATLRPTTNQSQTSYIREKDDVGGYDGYRYIAAGYEQERDAYFEVAAADVDNDGVDEIFSYSGAYVDRGGIRYAIVDMFDRQGASGTWNHAVTELDAGRADAYATMQELDEAADDHDDNGEIQYLKMAPVVTLAGGDLDRKGGEEIVMTVSAPTDHDSPKDAAKCFIYTWDDATQTLCGIDGLNEEVGGAYIPLYSPNPPAGVSSEAMVSANCAFGTFQIPGSDYTADALIVAGWDCGDGSHLSKSNKYLNAGYRYVYFDPGKDEFVVSDYLTKPLGKDASHIVDTATMKCDQDERYAPTLAPFALGCARLQGLHQGVENDQVLFGGEIYDFSIGGTGGLAAQYAKSISMCSDQYNYAGNYIDGNHKKKEQVWIGDVVAGNVSESDNYEESFLAVIGVHRDEEVGDSDDYYWFDVAHYTGKYQSDHFTYVTGQEGVVCKGCDRNDRRGTWVSLCLPNVLHRGIQLKYQDMAKVYTSPQILAMLEDAPYFGDLQESFHYIVLGGTGFERSEAQSSGSSWSIEGSLGIWASASGGFLGRAELENEVSIHRGYDSQNMSTLEYGVSYESHAGEGNKVVVYAVPLVYYHYQISDPDHPGTWQDIVIPEYLEPSTAIVSADVWDEAAEQIGAPKVEDVLKNASGDPSTYTASALGEGRGADKGLSVTRAFTAKQSVVANNSQGATITQSIATENEEEQAVSHGPAIAFKAGGGFGIGETEALMGMMFDASAGFSQIRSSSRAFTFEGAVDNLPEQAEGYSFPWKLAVNKSHREMASDATEPSDNQFWIVGYEVDQSALRVPAARAVSGLAATAVTDHSVTLSWDDVLPAGSGYDYVVAMLDANGTLSDWKVVPAGTTTYEWGSQPGREIEPSTTYRFVVTAMNSATGARGVRSAPFSVSTLPKGHALTISGVDVVEPEGSSRDASVPVGSPLALREGATYSITDDAGQTTYWKPRFTWYRKDLRSATGSLVGLDDGLGMTYGEAAAEALQKRLDGGAAQLQADSDGQQTSTYSVPAVSAADDGSVWYCNVSYNNVLVSSQPVYLDVTHTVIPAGTDQVVSGRRPRLSLLEAGSAHRFGELKPGETVPADGGTTDDGGSGSDATGAAGRDDGAGTLSQQQASGQGAEASSQPVSAQSAITRLIPKMGDPSSFGPAVLVAGAAGAALIALGLRLRKR